MARTLRGYSRDTPPPCVFQYRISLGVSCPIAWHFLGGAGRVTPPTALGLVHHLFTGGWGGDRSSGLFFSLMYLFLAALDLSWSMRTLSCGTWHLVPQLEIKLWPVHWDSVHWEHRVLAIRDHQGSPCFEFFFVVSNSHLCFYKISRSEVLAF